MTFGVHLDCPPETFLENVIRGERLTAEKALQLFSVDLSILGKAAAAVCRKFHPDPVATFVIDRNISCTNVCVAECDFCAFHCAPDHPKAYVLKEDEILSKVRELVDSGGTQVLIQGGLNPDLPFDYYLNMVKRIHQEFPQVHIHSFSAVEIDFLSRKAKKSIEEILNELKNAGLNSLPGGGAEILVDRVRQKISPRKISADGWIQCMRTVHRLGLKSTATMVFGHIETLEERIQHLNRIRELQDKTHGFRAFIPWSLSPCGTPRMSEIPPAGGIDYLKMVAISRLFLDNIPNIQAGWLTEGVKLAQVALAFGANDMGGILFEDKVLEPTGIQVKTKVQDMVRFIREAGLVPAQRDTNYQILKTF
ncbi:MAG: dehypoxanthine futalosine cyclase [Omnitrophica bacterium RIFCSPLOWO2_12_FULL_44_17]|uniref:Cyclic dehypoxanthine futalosine synthase n=1 Tax=Candidatus Danuiimicrobium aquiferis TaxID=1801832 RepID=A0A1G1KQM4_9BACT|nr:MAG: dehypoxanthine futalosine cyclase [Omnitrophica bacterium RIFCSPHIGHO2_02_FULL_45_28]OGW88404.1 MAG: dehypoxanthine futalosine cyclase [Omnitrophica bacterium RIFCSPHIGHO2_12_FULL_44_12]OGW95206.1 MAG: dehypoxanthine futalosine cyclase [Omnitrophica bacterium RIFCSPLOWO2_12_FULL_44_17]OGX01649.1 MAG: dehypoxanthine futalosine cyclase [Omnitrophica bacterium RIFCSPLOWO2_02_FULL_44_11]